ncbi:MAG: hypothetical protein GXP24_07605 [Planctomycetes bacterium]|nr:hypothetical protein [Planctomycetota bacterium]
MQQSGTKLVLALVGLAFLLGLTSWWYRYEAAHRASQFWGPEASRLIAESKGLQVWEEGALTVSALHLNIMSIDFHEVQDLSHARGQAHLRHALMSDRNYVWGEPLDSAAIEWRWCLRFHEGERQVQVLLSGNLSEIGKYEPTNQSVIAFSCEPMTASLQQYFGALGLAEIAN